MKLAIAAHSGLIQPGDPGVCVIDNVDSDCAEYADSDPIRSDSLSQIDDILPVRKEITRISELILQNVYTYDDGSMDIS
jgi:hypothetical protein